MLRLMIHDNAESCELARHPPPATRHPKRWLHWWAVLTFCAACPLLLLGAEVTTKGVGMVDQRGFRAPWHLLEGSPWEKGLGYIIEHAHRLAGFVVGSCVIVLALGLWLGEPRRWVRWLGLAALAGVSAQGVLGIFRIEQNPLMGRTLALVHGCFAQVVFALLVSVALVTSRWWQQVEASASRRETARLRHGALVTAGLVYLQAVLGAVVRHRDWSLGARAHLLVAFAVVAAVAWVVKEVIENPQRTRTESVAAVALAGLVALQLLLGVESWLSKFPSQGTLEWRQLTPLMLDKDLVRSAHYFVGTLVFAGAVVMSLQAHRRTAWLTQPAVAPAGRLEGAA
jgi:cytochrome c oxidase assembly protein subunit 15